MARSDFARVLIPVSMATGLSLLGDTALYTVLPTHTADAGIALANLGLLLSVNRFIRLGLNGPIGVLTDRIPRRHIFVPALYLGAITTAIYALSRGLLPLLLARLLWGVAWAGIWVCGNAIVLDVTGHGSRGRGVGIYHLSFFLGAAAGSSVGGLLTDLVGYRWAMGVASLLSAFGATLALLLLPETSQARSQAMPYVPDKPAPLPRPIKGQLASATALLGTTRLVMAGILIATFGLFLAEKLGQKVDIGQLSVGVTSLTGFALGASTLVAMVAAPVAGAISDRLQVRWPVVSGGLSSGVAGFGLLALGSPLTILLGLPLTSASSGSSQGLATAMVGDFSRRVKHGRQLGILYTIGDLGSAVGPLIAYTLLPLTGLATVYWLCAAVLGVMLLIALAWSSVLPARTAIAR
jgi:MFS family permease